MSLTTFIDYLTAPAARRRQILLNQKHRADFTTGYYDPARQALAAVLAGGSTFAGTDAIDRLVQRQNASDDDFERRRSAGNAEAIASFLEFHRAVLPAGATALPAIPAPGTIVVEDVDLAIAPDVILHGEDTPRGKLVGGITWFFSKTDRVRLTADTARYASALVYEWLSTAQLERVAVREWCRVVDVFGKQVFPAPQHYQRALTDLRAACQEIAARWETI
jgi:hypothetical protein